MLFFQSHSRCDGFFFTTLHSFPWYSATFCHLICQCQSSPLHDLLTLLQISQRTRVYPPHNLKERTCWTLIQESLVWVRGVRMCLWGKGRVENHGRRGDSSFSRPPSASQHRRKSLRTLRCTTTLLHAPAQTHRQTNSEEQCFLHPLRNEQVCNLPLYKLVSDTHSHCSDRYYERE